MKTLLFATTAIIFAAVTFGCREQHSSQPPALVPPAVGQSLEDEEKVIELIQERGGTVERDSSLLGNPVVAVSYRNCSAGRNDVELLQSLEHLRRLDLATDGVRKGADMEHVVPFLARLASLEEIDLSGGLLRAAKVPNLTGLRKLKKLRKLNLSRWAPFGEFLEDWKDTLDQLSGVESLESLNLSRNVLRQWSLGVGVALDPLKNLKNLQELALADTKLEAEDLKPLLALDKIRSLDLSGLDIRDSVLAELKGMTDLERLELRGTRVTGVSITAFPKLRRLNLSYVGRRDALGINAIASLPVLEDLSLAEESSASSVLELEDLRPIAKLKSLRRLDLSGMSELTGQVFDLLSDLPALEDLDLSLTQAAQNDPGKLAGLTALRTLRVAAFKNNITSPTQLFHEVSVTPGAGDEAMARVAALPELEHLDLTGTAVTDAGLKPLAAAPKLRRIILNRTKVTDAGLKTISASPALHRLELSGTAASDTGVLALKDALALEELDLSFTKVMDTGLKAVGAIPRLTYLDVSGTEITNSGIGELAGLQKLRVLVLRKTKFTNAGIPHLAKLKGLRTIYVDSSVDLFPNYKEEKMRKSPIPGLRVEAY